MPLINNQKFAITKWQMDCALVVLQHDRDIFKNARMRDARQKFIAGSAVLKAIKEWLLAAQVITKESGSYELTKFGRILRQHDSHLENSSSWWALHLAICFSPNRKEPYASLFGFLDNLGRGYVSFESIQKQTLEKLSEYSEDSINSSYIGVLDMFEKDQPLADLGLIEFLKQNNKKYLRLGKPEVTDEIILHGLALMRHMVFSSRSTVDLSEIIKNNLHAYLCLTVDEFRRHLQRMNSSRLWGSYFVFTENANLNSIVFEDNLKVDNTLLILLQNSKEIWF